MLSQGQLLDRVDCLLATVSPDVNVVNCDDNVPGAQSCAVSDAVGSNSLNREAASAFSKFDLLHQRAKIEGDSARFAVSYAVLERGKTERKRILTINDNFKVGGGTGSR